MFTAKKVDIKIHHNNTHTIQHTYSYQYKKGKDSMVCQFLVLFTFGFASQQTFDVLLLVFTVVAAAAVCYNKNNNNMQLTAQSSCAAQHF